MFLFSHIIYCSVDKFECIDFNTYANCTKHVATVDESRRILAAAPNEAECTAAGSDCLFHPERQTSVCSEPDTTWSKMQKSVAFVLCCAGCAVYALNKSKTRAAAAAAAPP